MADRAQDWQSEKGFPETNLHMLESQLLTDVTFLVGDQRQIIQAHKFILVSRSCVFETMFCGPLCETDSVEIPDIEADVFTSFLRYLYTSDVYLDPSTILSMLYVAKKYSVTGLEKLCVKYCHSALLPSNACTFLQQAFIFDENDLKARSLDVIKSNTKECLSSESFGDLGQDCLNYILQTDELNTDEVEVFKAAMTWAEAECRRQGREVTPTMKREVLGKSLFLIRFPFISEYNLSTCVCPANVLTYEELVMLYRRYSVPHLPVEPFITVGRTAVYTLSRSPLTEYEGVSVSSDRKDAITLVPDKPVRLLGLYLYSGNLSITHEMSVDAIVWDEQKIKVASQSTKVTVSPGIREYKVSFANPVPLQANKQIILQAMCNGRERKLCAMNGFSIMSDHSANIKWKIKHVPGYTNSNNSLSYGHITGIVYSL